MPNPPQITATRIELDRIISFLAPSFESDRPLSLTHAKVCYMLAVSARALIASVDPTLPKASGDISNG